MSGSEYGDLVLWFQTIDKAKESNQPILLITDDRKDDWWLKFEGRTIGPQPELVHEIVSEADVSFYMYSADPFMEYASKYLKRQVNQRAIEEVRKIRRRDEYEALAAIKAALVESQLAVVRALGEPQLAAIKAALVEPQLAAVRAALGEPQGEAQEESDEQVDE